MAPIRAATIEKAICILEKHLDSDDEFLKQKAAATILKDTPLKPDIDQNITKEPWILSLWRKVFKGWEWLPLAYLKNKRKNQLNKSEKYNCEEIESFIEKGVFGFCLLSILIFLVFSLLHFLKPIPNWLLYIETVFVILGGLRCFEIFVVEFNVLIFDPYNEAKKGKPYSIRSIYRMLLLLLHNYVEVIFWFSIFYRCLDGWFDSFGHQLYALSLKSLYFSFFNMSTFGQAIAGTVCSRDWQGSIVILIQACFGLFMVLLILARFINSLPPPKTEDENEKRLLS